MTPGKPLGTLPPCLVARGGRVSLTPNKWLTWHPDPTLDPVPLPAEWVIRQLQTIDLDDPLWLMTVLDVRGMCWATVETLRDPAVTPEELGAAVRPACDDMHARVHLSDVHATLAALRAAAGQWLLHARDGTPLPGSFWWLLHAGTRQFTIPVVERSDVLTGDLFEAAAWQLYGLTRDRAPIKRCQNERCGRLFYRQSSDPRYGQYLTTGIKYCSPQCREAQKKRVARLRERADL